MTLMQGWEFFFTTGGFLVFIPKYMYDPSCKLLVYREGVLARIC